MKDGKGKLPEDAYVVIWTTTPWTIPANLAITLNPKFEYGLFDTDKGKLLFLLSAKERLSEELGLSQCELLSSFRGQQLEGVVAEHPLYGRPSPLLNASFVTEDTGTGCVHTAPDHGLDDFNVCSRYLIKPFCPVDEKGYMHLGEFDPCDGLFYAEANDKVIDLLNEKGAILKEEDIVHSYPHDWRTKKPVIFRATPQWFCSIEPIRTKLLEAIKKIKWLPSWGEGKMHNMIADRADWCISRQRAWGVPIPIIYNEDGSPIIEEKVFDHIKELIKEHGSSIWFDLEPKDLLPEGYTNPASPNMKFTKETDIMDVWFDSGSSWNEAVKARGFKYPADLYLEGNDQYRGWFNASLILSLACTGEASFKTCLTHGFVMDENWQKMSKSKGNGIDPNKIASEFGADILRLWAATVDFTADARIGERIINSAVDNYRKIRNTFKFMLGVAGKAQEAKDCDFSFFDQFILARLEQVKDKALQSYESFDFPSVVNPIINFLSVDLSSLYLDANKDVFYCDSLNSSRRVAAVEVVRRCLFTLCLLLNPILPFTMEEVYSYIEKEDKKESVQLEDMPKLSHDYDPSLLEDYDAYLSLRDLANKAIEEQRASGRLGSSTDAALRLSCEGELYQGLSSVDPEELALMFTVGKARLQEGKATASCEKDERPVCARCRKHHDDLVETEEGPLCGRCRKAIGK